MPRLRSVARPLAVLMALVLVAPACGDDDDGSAAGDPAPTETPTVELVEGDHEGDHEGDPGSGGFEPDSWPLQTGGPTLPAVVTDATGGEVTIVAAERIGSMPGSVSEVLWTLGYGDHIVVIDSTTRYPAELAGLPNVGFFRSLPAEGLIAQSPDVLFVPLDAGPPEALAAVEAAGVAVVRLPIDGPGVESLRSTIELVGGALGDLDHARNLADAVVGEFESVSVEPAADAPIVAYAVARGQNIMLTGLDNPSNTFVAAAGYRPAASILELSEAAPLTPEAMVLADPAVIVTTRTSVEQAGGEGAFLAAPGIAQTTAAKNGALVVWEDDQSIQLWTPRAPLTVAALAEAISSAIG